MDRQGTTNTNHRNQAPSPNSFDGSPLSVRPPSGGLFCLEPCRQACQNQGGGIDAFVMPGGGFGFLAALTHQEAAATAPNQNLQEATIEQRMAGLSVQERVTAEETILGKSTPAPMPQADTLPLSGFPEDPYFLSQKFEALDRELRKAEAHAAQAAALPPQQQSSLLPQDDAFAAYALAREQDWTYVANPRFRIGFLRAASYDPPKAAIRLLAYLTEKLDLFGPERLTRDLCLEDIGKDGQKFMGLGAFHILPERDSAGRLVLFGHTVGSNGKLPKKVLERAIKAFKKYFFYIVTTVAEDDTEMGKIKGVVAVCWRIGKKNTYSKEEGDAYDSVRDCAPVRVSGMHICNDPIRFSLGAINEFATAFLPSVVRAGMIDVTRAHFGTAMDCQYKLILNYGIPSHLFPLLEENSTDPHRSRAGNLHLRYVNEWKDHRMRVEATKQQRGVGSSVSTTFRGGTSEHGTKPLRMSNGSTAMSSLASSLFSHTEQNLGLFESHTRDSLLLSDDPIDAAGSIMNESMGTLDFSDYEGFVEGVGAHHPDGRKPGNNEDEEPAASSGTESPRTVLVEEEATTSPAVAPTTEHPDPIPDSSVRPQDVLPGRGRVKVKHPGNVAMRELIAKNIDRYDAGSKLEKVELTKAILDTIARSGGRFLKPLSKEKTEKGLQLWVELDRDKAHSKIAVAFRDFRKQRKKAMAQ